LRVTVAPRQEATGLAGRGGGRAAVEHGLKAPEVVGRVDVEPRWQTDGL